MVTRHTYWSVHVFGAVLSEQRALRLSSVLWIPLELFLMSVRPEIAQSV
jgi:hypothetical protein